MISETTLKGELAALKVDQRAIELGYVSARPVFDCAYDRILEKDGKFYRVQVKFVGSEKSNPVSGSSVVRLTRIGHESSKAKTYSANEVDIVIAYIESLDCFVWLTPDKFADKTVISIRYEAAKNGQSKGCCMLDDCKW